MVRYLLLLFFFISLGTMASAQTTLYGKVKDQDTGETIPFASVALYKNGVLVTGEVTDFDGNFNFSPIDPGTYDVQVSFTGYTPQKIAGIQVLAGKANKVDVEMGSGIVLEEVVVKEYKAPLIEQDNTTSGAVITSDQIRQLPTRNINALAATSAGLASSDEGGAITVRGSRSNATDYYVDGIRVQGSLIPESEIDQLQVITGGIEARYGDVTGGIISITTKGPSSKFSGGIELETSRFLDPYENSIIGGNLSGPILKNKNGESVIGFRLSGRYTDRLDDDPPATDIFRVSDSVLEGLEANPLVNLGGAVFVAADTLTNKDVDVLDYKPGERNQRLDLTAKIDARLSKSVDVTLTGAYRQSENFFTPGGWRLMNTHNNPFTDFESYRGNFRFRHRLGNSGAAAPNSPEDRAAKASVIQNASYTLQFGYEKTRSNTSDVRHGENYFDYGYIGNFDFEFQPNFDPVFDPFTGQILGFEHIGATRVLEGYTPGDVNPVLANYNNVLGIDGDGGNLPGFDEFFARNGAIRDIADDSWGFHSNVGTIRNEVNNTDNDTYTFTANAAFDIVTSGASGRHNIELGIWYEQRTNRSYTVFPRRLWTIARQLANNHIPGAVDTTSLGGTFEIEGFGDVQLYNYVINPGEDARFFEEIRKVTGTPINQYVTIDDLSPDQFSLDMFSAKELNDQNLLDYFGYTYTGEVFDGNFEDFFTDTIPGTSTRAFPVAPNRPIYAAAYIQDKFTYKDIIFRLGVRIDRYDANTKVLKDNYSLYEIQSAGDFHADPDRGEKPGSVGDDFKVYVNDAGTGVEAYRDGDQWYRANGTPVNQAIDIEELRDGIVTPFYANPNAREIVDYIKAPGFDVDASFEDYEVQVNIMPRIAVSFPISDEANFFAHYDVLVQRPPSNTLATALDYFYFIERTGSQNFNNPNLRPTRTVSYEAGFQQKLSTSSAIKIATYYRELRDMIQQRVFFPVPDVNQYTTFDNQDFGTVKGFTFQYDLRRTGNVSLQANYTLQFADGTGSDANSQGGINNRGNIRTLFPLNFDERHRFNLVLDYRYLSGKLYNGPRLFGADILENFGVNLQGVAVSGRPYTATRVPTQTGGSGTIGGINGARRPWQFTLNLRVDKSFKINNKLGVNVYCRISNLLDRRNVIAVYSASGSATDSGFLQSQFGRQTLETLANDPRGVDAYIASLGWAQVNPNLFSLPRRIFVGAILDF